MTVAQPRREVRLAPSSLWNLVGQVIPLAAAVVAIPVLLRGLGTDRFGILTLAWVVIGYFSLFDMGLGRALTKVVAEESAAGRVPGLPRLIWTAMLLMTLLGIAAMLGLLLLSPWLVDRALRIPPILRLETTRTFYLLAICVPIVIVTTGLRGILEGSMRFDLTNAIRIPLGLFPFLGPV